MGHLSPKRVRGGGLWEWGISLRRGSVEEASGGGGPSLGTLEGMLRKPPGAGISLHGGPFPHGWLPTCEGGGGRISGTLTDQ